MSDIETAMLHIPQKGSSLIEISILVIVLSILIAAGLSLHKQHDWARRHSDTQIAFKKIDLALKEYQKANLVLPCPAPMAAEADSAEYGRAQPQCHGTIKTFGRITPANGDGAVYIGTVPLRTLNLHDEFSVDGWNRRFVYAVTGYHTSGNPDMTRNGAISIVDDKGIHVTSQNGNVIYLVLSPGADSRGAYPINGIEPIEECAPETLAGENCDNDTVFLNSLPRQWDVGALTNTASMIYKAGK